MRFCFVKHRRAVEQALCHRTRAYGLLEFSLVLPIFLLVFMVGVQLSLLMMAQLTVIWIANDVVRYAATSKTVSGSTVSNWQLADSCNITYRNTKLPPILISTNLVSISPTDFVPAYSPGTSSCTSVAGNSPAASPTYRQRGSLLQFSMQYTPNNLYFLPTSFFYNTPTRPSLPQYTTSAVME